MTIAISPVSIVSHTNLTPSAKEAERQQLAALVNQHLASGGAISTVPGFKQVPPPPRIKHVEPETVLKRRRPKLQAQPTQPPQPTFAQLAEQVAAEPAPEFAAIVEGLRKLAAEGQSLMGAARQLGISETKARWHAKRCGIVFAKPRGLAKINDTALLALARVLADGGETLNMAAKKLSCGADRLQRLAALHGIEFRKGAFGGRHEQKKAQ